MYPNKKYREKNLITFGEIVRLYVHLSIQLRIGQ